jgi:hypothetical protein
MMNAPTPIARLVPVIASPPVAPDQLAVCWADHEAAACGASYRMRSIVMPASMPKMSRYAPRASLSGAVIPAPAVEKLLLLPQGKSSVRATADRA